MAQPNYYLRVSNVIFHELSENIKKNKKKKFFFFIYIYVILKLFNKV